ncbi:MAG: hypothetical protein HC841_04190, partial [Verrucomicrobiae bacterium]|nr:hypothetical protein [Verrucomicrobiae bacterium]
MASSSHQFFRRANHRCGESVNNAMQNTHYYTYDKIGNRLTEQIKALRKQLARELGFVMPSVRIQDNMQLGANQYVVKVKEIEAGGGNIKPNMLLVMNPTG